MPPESLVTLSNLVGAFPTTDYLKMLSTSVLGAFAVRHCPDWHN